MKWYWVKTHWLIQRIFSGFIWKFPTQEKIVYLTFDDGPTPEITTWVLTLLEKYNAKATFFCIGKNISEHPEICKKIQFAGHSLGNHTNNHLNGWQTANDVYIENVLSCENKIKNILIETNSDSKIFRPPYGKLKPKQSQLLTEKGYKIIMWNVLSADFDLSISPEKCAQNVIKNIHPGSIVIFHDSLKASINLQHALPKTLEFLKKNNYQMKAIRFAAAPN